MFRRGFTNDAHSALAKTDLDVGTKVVCERGDDGAKGFDGTVKERVNVKARKRDALSKIVEFNANGAKKDDALAIRENPTLDHRILVGRIEWSVHQRLGREFKVIDTKDGSLFLGIRGIKDGKVVVVLRVLDEKGRIVIKDDAREATVRVCRWFGLWKEFKRSIGLL